MKRYLKLLLLISCTLLSRGYLAAQEVDADALNGTPASCATEALQGLLPWMNVTSSAWMPWLESRISLRGEISENGTQPLVLVDGVEMSLDMLDPSVIGSVEVLKDAAAAAIYGSRAAAGAIIVRTKNAGGLTVKPFISLNAFAGLSSDSALTHNYKVSAAGGNESVSYYFGAHYFGHKSNGISSGNVPGLDKAGITGNLNAKITPWLQYSLGLDYTYKGIDPAFETGEVIRDRIQNILMKNMLRANIADCLTLDVSYAFRNRYDFITDRLAQHVYEFGVGKDFYAEIRDRFTDSDASAHLNYGGIFSEKHEVKAVLGYDMQFGMNKHVGASVNNLKDPTLSVLTIGDGRFSVGENKAEYMMCGVFVNGTYTFEKRYKAEITLREDGNSRLPRKNRWGLSGSGAIEWSIDSEDFFKPAAEYVNSLKLRYSFASVCDQNLVPFYGWYASINPEGGVSSFLFDKAGLSRYSCWNAAVASDLKPERVNTHNVSLFASFLKNRLSFEGDFFFRNVNDMLTPSAVVPGIFGWEAPYMNQGSATAGGFELSLAWKDRTPGDFTYSLKAMFADHTTSVKNLPDPRLSYALDASLLWKSVDFSILLSGVGRYDWPIDGICGDCSHFSVRNVTLGYTLPFREGCSVRSMRFGIAGRNLLLAGRKLPAADFDFIYPMSAVLNIGINF